MEKYTCPVCGYPDLDDPAYDLLGIPLFSICACCGCEFGYQDATEKSKNRFLKGWIKRGAPWRNPEKRPINWDPKIQLRAIGIDIDVLQD